MKSAIFYSDEFLKIETDIKNFLNSQDKAKLGLVATVREAGDRIKKVLSNNLKNILVDYLKDFEIPQTARAMANFKFVGKDGLNYCVDVISHNEEKKFSMPNITSVDRLEKYYRDDKNVFIVLLVDYKPSKTSNFITKVKFLPIEFYSWKSLTIGALGIGQLQIKRASKIIHVLKKSRKKWMIEFAENLMVFYAKETGKAAKRLTSSANTLETWKEKKDLWH